MRKFLAAFILFVSASIAAFGQAYIPVSGARIKNNISLPLTGQLRFTVTDANDVPITYTPEGGSSTTAQILIPVVSGSIPSVSGFQATIPNPETMSPSGSFYRMEIMQSGISVLTFPHISINTASFSVDGFSVPKGVIASGLGMPQWPCTPGSMYNDTTAPAPYPWICSQLNSDNSVVWTQNPSIVPMCQKGNSQAIGSPINATGPPFCLPVTQAWSTPGYVVAGPAQTQAKNGQVGLVSISDLCAGGACGTGGGGNPAGQPQDIQFHGATNIFDADSPGKFTYDKVYHMLRTNVNAMLNSDIYRTSGTGNDGIANALASTECISGCEVDVPATSTSTEVIPLPPSGKTVVSSRGNASIRVSHNPSTASTYDPGTGFDCNGQQNGDCEIFEFDTPDVAAGAIDARPIGRAIVYRSDQWGYDYGNAPGTNGATWNVGKADTVSALVNSQGIFQAHSDWIRKYGIGDIVLGRNVDGQSDGGQPDFSGEGIVVDRDLSGETSTYYHGLVASGATTGTTNLPVAYNTGISTNNRNKTSSGAYLLDISKGTVSGLITGNGGVIGGIPNTVGTIPIDQNVTPSTAYGVVSCDMPVPTPSNPNLTGTITCTITNLHGTTGMFTAGLAEIGGDFPEQVTISNPGAVSGGSQVVTMAYKNPHGATQTSLWQGGSMMGQWISHDTPYAIAGFREAYHVFGATDSNHIVVEQAYPGSGGPYNDYVAPVPIKTLTKSGTTVTGYFVDGNGNPGQFNKMAAVISGCSDSGLNQSITNVSVNYKTLSFTGTQPAGGTGCNTANISLPAPINGFHIYPGAAVLGPAVDSPTSIPLEPNQVAWTSGDQIEIPHHPMLSIQRTRSFQTINNALQQKYSGPTGLFFAFGGGGINSNYRSIELANLNVCSMYQGCGGTLSPPPAIEIGGYGHEGINGGFVEMATTPLNGRAIINILSPPSTLGGAANTDPIPLYNFAWKTASQIYYYPDQNSYVAPSLVSGFGGIPYGYFRGGRYWVNGPTSGDPASFGGVYFSIDGSNEITRMGLCSKFTSTKEVSFGACSPWGATDINVTDGKVNALSIRAQLDATVGSLVVGLQPPWGFLGVSYTGTPGTTSRIYYYSVQSPLGIQGPPVNGTGNTINNTAATLDASNYVTLTCPTTLQANWPAGTTYHVMFRVSGSNTVDLGTCPVGGSIVDDGTLTNGAPGLANITSSANMPATAAGYYVANGGGIGFYNSNRGGSLDTYINRIGPNKLGIGSTFGSGHNGTLELGGLQLDNIAGGGPQCLQADNTGIVTGTGAPCGSGGGGGSGTVTSVSKDDTGVASLLTVSISNPTTTPQLTFSLSQAGAHQFLGNNTGALATPGYFQPAFTDIAGIATPSQLPAATTSALGAVKPDGSTITVDVDGTIHSVGGGGGTNPTANGMQYWDNTAHSWSAVSGLTVTAGAVSGIHVVGGSGLVASSGIIDGYFADFVTTATTVAVAPAVTGGICDDGTTARSCAGAKYYNNVTGGTAAVTYTLLPAVAGSWYCFQNYSGVTSLMTIQTSGAGQYIDVQGTPTASGGYITMPGAAGDAVCVEAADSTHWFAHASSGTPTTH